MMRVSPCDEPRSCIGSNCSKPQTSWPATASRAQMLSPATPSPTTATFIPPPLRGMKGAWKAVSVGPMSEAVSLKDKIKGQVEAFDRWARPWAEKSKWNGWAYEFLLFGLKQAWACLFGGAMIALL